MCRSDIHTWYRGSRARLRPDPGASRAAVVGFGVHLAAYLFVTAVLVALNVIFWSGSFWAVWPMMGWGIGLCSHGAQVVRMLLPAVSGDAPRPTYGVQDDTVQVTVSEWERMTRRLEHLEAIVVNEGWEPSQPHAREAGRG